MKFLNILAAFSLILFVGCGGGEDTSDQQAEGQEQATVDDVRTIEVIGIDEMKFVIEDENQEGITLGENTGQANLPLLETITASPGEEIRIRLTTQSDMPASAMAHNWILLTMDSDPQAFADAAAKARDNDYIPADMEDEIIATTDLAAGGETVEVTLNVPEEPGEYTFICSFPGHYAASMSGTLVVEE